MSQLLGLYVFETFVLCALGGHLSDFAIFPYCGGLFSRVVIAKPFLGRASLPWIGSILGYSFFTQAALERALRLIVPRLLFLLWSRMFATSLSRQKQQNNTKADSSGKV
jgi:hypothetical protein